MLYTTPNIYIKSVDIDTKVQNETGEIHFKIGSNVNQSDFVSAKVMVYDKDRNLVATQVANDKLEGVASIDKVKLWWPFLMHPEPAYLYTLEVHLSTRQQEDVDIYRMKVKLKRKDLRCAKLDITL